MTPHAVCNSSKVYLSYRQSKETTSEGVKRLLHEVLQESFELNHHPNGAPYLPTHPHLNISISHSHHYIALIIDEQGLRLGIDIEEKAVQAARLLDRYTEERERTLITRTAQPPLLLWCAKEALYKAFSDSMTGFGERLIIEAIHDQEIEALVYLDDQTTRRALLHYHIKNDLEYPYILTYLSCEKIETKYS